jgi:hypothetical protein
MCCPATAPSRTTPTAAVVAESTRRSAGSAATVLDCMLEQ